MVASPRPRRGAPSSPPTASRLVFVDDRDVGLGARLGVLVGVVVRLEPARRGRECRAARRGTAGPGAGTPRRDARRRRRARRRRCRSCARRRASTSRYSTDDPLRSPTPRAGDRFARPVHAPAARLQQVGLDELAHRVVEAVAEPAFVVGCERQLVRRARDLGAQHERVLRVDDRALGRAAASARAGARRTTGRAGRRRRRAPRPTRRPVRPARPGLLPHRRERAGEAVEHDGVEPADVDAELERVRGGDAEQLAAREVAFELAPLLGQVAGAVRGDRCPRRAALGCSRRPRGPARRRARRPAGCG